MTQTAITREPVAGRRLKAERLNGARALREAQALRYRVFSAEFDAKLEGAEDGLDRDDYDRHCAHIGVRDLDSGALVATTRLLDHRAAERPGASTAKRSSTSPASTPCTARSWRSAAPASLPNTATAPPSRYSGANSPRSSTRAATAT